MLAAAVLLCKETEDKCACNRIDSDIGVSVDIVRTTRMPYASLDRVIGLRHSECDDPDQLIA